MSNGIKTLEWRICRIFVKWWVKRLIRKQIEFIEKNKFNQSSRNSAKVRLNKARIEFWHSEFQSWGTWNKFGGGCFCYESSQVEVFEKELEEIGFNKKLDFDKSDD